MPLPLGLGAVILPDLLRLNFVRFSDHLQPPRNRDRPEFCTPCCTPFVEKHRKHG